MAARQGFKQCASRGRGTTLAGAALVAFLALAPVALGEPAEDQYNFNPPSPGGGGGESSSDGTTGGLPGTTSDGQGPGGTASPLSKKSQGDGPLADAGSGAAGSSSTFLDADDSGSSSSDGGVFSAIADSIGSGPMPIVLAAIAAIGVAGGSVVLYRRRERTHGEPV